MWEEKTGYCPVHNSELTIEVEYATVRAIGLTPQRKAVRHKCAESNDLRKECSNCPLAYGSFRGAL